MPVILQSEVLANFLQETGENRGENFAIFVKIFALHFKGKWQENVHGKSSTFSAVHQPKFFHCCKPKFLDVVENGPLSSRPHVLEKQKTRGQARELDRRCYVFRETHHFGHLQTDKIREMSRASWEAKNLLNLSNYKHSGSEGFE